LFRKGNDKHVADAIECFGNVFQDFNMNLENFNNADKILRSEFVNELTLKLFQFLDKKNDDKIREKSLSCLNNLLVS
jgi:hypothetical protein